MRIVGLQKVTLLDYPGQIAASVFLAGCNLNCGYCHNRWMIAADKESGQVAPEVISVGDLLRWLGTRQGLLDGVCISGGEPTLSAGCGPFAGIAAWGWPSSWIPRHPPGGWPRS